MTQGQRRRPCQEQHTGALPWLEGLGLCQVGWGSHICVSPRVGVWPPGHLEEVQHLLAEGKSTIPSSLSAVPSAHQEETELSVTCARGEAVSPRLTHEAAREGWIRWQGVVIAWSSLLRAKQCVCAERVQKPIKLRGRMALPTAAALETKWAERRSESKQALSV